MWVKQSTIPQITIFIGGMVTIPSHGWYKWHCFTLELPQSPKTHQNPQAGQGDTARAKLVLFEFGQNDPKMDSGVRLCRGPA
jgi:hypothetical protein